MQDTAFSWPHFTDEKTDRPTLGSRNSTELALEIRTLSSQHATHLPATQTSKTGKDLTDGAGGAVGIASGS